LFLSIPFLNYAYPSGTTIQSALRENVTPYNSSVFIKSIKTKQSLYQRSYVRERARDVVMQASDPKVQQLISRQLLNLSCMNLAAKIKLSAFPDLVVLDALNRLKRSKREIHNKFGWVYKTCELICERSGKRADFDRANQIFSEIGSFEEDPVISMPTTLTSGSGMGDPERKAAAVEAVREQQARGEHVYVSPISDRNGDPVIDSAKWDADNVSMAYFDRTGCYIANPYRNRTSDEVKMEAENPPKGFQDDIKMLLATMLRNRWETT
jgi:hypothetical protein